MKNKKIRTLIVISNINYVPKNSNTLIEKLLTEKKESIAGIVFIQNANLKLFGSIFWLFMNKCFSIGSVLFINLLSLIRDRRIKLLNKNSIPFYYVKTVNSPKSLKLLKKINPDLIINIRTRNIYKKEILNLPKYGCYNIHHGLLPKYRGMYCDIYALYEKRPAGISLHRMNNKIDDGEIIETKIISDKQERDYINYLSHSHNAETEVVVNLINYIEKYKSPPKGKINNCDNIVYTKTPTEKEIKKMIDSGLIL